MERRQAERQLSSTEQTGLSRMEFATIWKTERQPEASLRRGNAQNATAPTSQLKQFQFRQILRIDDSDRHAMIIHHHEIVDPMTLEQVEHFDC